jgi:acyl carrier protein
VPPGKPGELHIGGAGLARGYVNRPDLTAQKFIPHPFSARPGDRLYKTGDLVRRLPDGQLAFLGRIDEQVKIRGYRIEPAEIVAALDEHPAVAESAVVARDVEGDKRLVAYVVPTAGSRPTPRALRDFLGRRLPDYMVPAAFVALEALPLNANGKVDRESLPAPDDHCLRDEELVAPRTVVEERVAELLARLLGLDRVGVNDNFFMLGGHSLLATQLIARLREVFSIELDLRTLFDRPTVAGLAAEVERLVVEKLEAMPEEEAERLLRQPPRGASTSR